VVLGSLGFLKFSLRKYDAKVGFMSVKDLPVMFIFPDDMALLPGVNVYVSVFHMKVLFCQNVTREKLRQALLYEKRECKMLMKLTLG